jgi:hypothetical protein
MMVSSTTISSPVKLEPTNDGVGDRQRPVREMTNKSHNLFTQLIAMEENGGGGGNAAKDGTRAAGNVSA